MTTSLANLFVITYPPLLLKCTKLICVLIITCWLRISEYTVTILRGLTLCWRRICEAEKMDSLLVEVQKDLKVIVALLRRIEEDNSGLDRYTKSLWKRKTAHTNCSLHSKNFLAMYKVFFCSPSN